MSIVFDETADASAEAAQLRNLNASRLGINFVHPLDAEMVAKAEAREKAERARWEAQNAQEADERKRITALQLAAAVCGSHGDPGVVLDAARDFNAFLNGADSRPN